MIDWFTVVAQIFNFVVLALLLKHFLYRPVLKAVDARDKLVQSRLDEARAKKQDAEQKLLELQHQKEELEHDRQGLHDQAVKDAAGERARLIAGAQRESEELRAQLHKGVADERDALSKALTLRAQQEALAIARAALSDLADADLYERMTAVFIRRFQALSSEERGLLIAPAGTPALLRTASPLDADQQAALERSLKEILAPGNRLQFESSPELVSGVELSANGHKLAWSVRGYLKSLEGSVDELLKNEAVGGS